MLKLSLERDSLNVIFDQIGTPTYAIDLAKVIMDIVQHDAFQQEFNSDIVHYSNEGVCSWYDFAKTIFELSQTPCDVSPIETKDYPTPATRPHYSLLNKSKIKQRYEIALPYWKDSLQQCLNVLQEK
jgi:dTDP-4-dehydrorhamnose reductase